MCTPNYLERLLLLIPLIILTSCSNSEEAGRPSLNADDLWDQMTEERNKPLPVPEENTQAADSHETSRDPYPVTSSDPLSQKDIEAHRKTLLSAGEKYQTITTSLKAGFTALVKTAENTRDRQDAGRTIQLYLSRLTNLQKNMEGAVNALENITNNTADNQALLDQSHDMLDVISEHITRTRTRLDGLSPQ